MSTTTPSFSKGPQSPGSKTNWGECTGRKYFDHDSPLDRVQTPTPTQSFEKNLKTNVFRELEGAMNGNPKNNSYEGGGHQRGDQQPPSKTPKFQFRNPTPDSQNFSESQTNPGASRQNWGGRGRGPTYKRRQQTHEPGGQRGGKRGKRPRENEYSQDGGARRFPNNNSQNNPHNHHHQNPRDNQDLGRRDTTLSKREWALIDALRN